MAVLRRTVVALIAAALALTATGGAQAQDYPNRPIKLVVAFTAGGTTDFVARLLAERLRTLLGQPVIVENRPGANGAIAAEYVAKSDPDGYTLFFTTVGAVAINPALRGNLGYDPIKDFAPVGMAVFNSTMLVVNASMQVNSARELAALAKERPGAITIGITGLGAISHLGLELFQAAAGASARIASTSRSGSTSKSTSCGRSGALHRCSQPSAGQGTPARTPRAAAPSR